MKGENMGDLLEYLKSQQNEMLKMLQTLVEIESPSLEKEMNDLLGKKITEIFLSFTGGTMEIIPNQTYGNHLRGRWGQGDHQILLLAHRDTVWQSGDLQRNPFRIEGDKAYGPGIFDMKGGIVQGIYALHTLRNFQINPNCQVVFLITSDEEIGSPSSRQIIEEEAKKSDYVLVLEPPMYDYGALKTARKGVGMYKLKVTGQAAHSGIDHQKGKSAIEELAHQTLYLHKLTDYTIGTTVNVGTVKGGTRGNVVAAEAKAEVDIRVRTQAEFDRTIPLIENIVPAIEGTRIEVEGGINRPPLERTKEVGKMFELARNIGKEKLGIDLVEVETGGASDGNFTAPLAPTLDGLGPVGDGAHAVHEHVLIQDIPVRSALLGYLIGELARQKRHS
ncbi:M20 family metallopeptidase [Brevibacillus choshinensis]|nr:M20 family metallopeptidase [Brevibacillus choshinensis]